MIKPDIVNPLELDRTFRAKYKIGSEVFSVELRAENAKRAQRKFWALAYRDKETTSPYILLNIEEVP